MNANQQTATDPSPPLHSWLRCHRHIGKPQRNGSCGICGDRPDEEQTTGTWAWRHSLGDPLLFHAAVAYCAHSTWSDWPARRALQRCCFAAYFGRFSHTDGVRTMATEATKVVLESTLTCPSCGHVETETMPTDACQWFYECKSCQTVLKPLEGDCCVYCCLLYTSPSPRD